MANRILTPAEEKPLKRSNSKTKTHRPKRNSPPSPIHHAAHNDKNKRVWKACERCRMKKTKCDGEFPCKRCKDDGLICSIGTRKKIEYKQLPRGYAEVLEHSQLALIATIHKLYSMVRNSQTWDLDEPDLNDRGQPVVHTISSKLGCIRPTNEIDLPIESIFPEDDAGLKELASKLEAQQKEREAEAAATKSETDSTCCNLTERASSVELDHSDYELEMMTLSSGTANTNSSSLSSPQVYTYGFDGPTQPDVDFLFPTPSPTIGNFQQWAPFANSQQQPRSMVGVDMLSQAVIEAGFGSMKPPDLSAANAVMLGLGDPMIFQGSDWDTTAL